MMRVIKALVCAVSLMCGGGAFAQDQAALIADGISVQGNDLRAEGHVEVLFEGFRLTASAITYQSDSETIVFEGPMTLSDPEGGVIILAHAGELSQDFRNGVMTSARLVLDRQLQIAGTELRRVDGRYTQLVNAVASSCPVCAGSDTPLWQIRAERVLHDQVKHQVYYQNAVFEVSGIPIFYVPRLRIPDGSVERASGFLLPEFKTSSLLGTGILVPYFQTLGDNADLTVTPYVSAKTTTLGMRYRQLLKNGALTFDGALSNDQLTTDSYRGYLFGSGVFFFPRDYQLRFDLKTSSDESYLFDYGITGQDRLRSDVTLSRIKRATLFNGQIAAFRSFRDDETDGSIPAQITQVDYRKNFTPPIVGGRATYRFQTYGLERPSAIDIVGRDYARITGGLDYYRDTIFSPGLRAAAIGKFDFDAYAVSQDSTHSSGSAATSVGALELSWPLLRRTARGTDLLEPKIQLVSADTSSFVVPNEESTLVEFDEGALFLIDRIPGATAYERGTWVNAGATWNHVSVDGWTSDLTVGRVFRTADEGQFNEAMGLSGAVSDWLVAGHLDLGVGFNTSARMLFDDEFTISRTDIRASWVNDDFRIDNNFLWHTAEPEVGRDEDTLELHTDMTFPLSPNWEGSLDMRYDFAAQRAASAGLRLVYGGRCITADFGIDRTFTSSDSVRPKTDFTLTLSVPTVAVASTRPTHQCSR